MAQMMQKITTFLWFDNQAEEAVRFYTSIFDDSRGCLITRGLDCQDFTHDQRLPLRHAASAFKLESKAISSGLVQGISRLGLTAPIATVAPLTKVAATIENAIANVCRHYGMLEGQAEYAACVTTGRHWPCSSEPATRYMRSSGGNTLQVTPA